MDKFRFLNWDVYRDAQELFGLILNIVRKIPKEYRFEIGSQLTRSSFSVILNIAEGSGKGTDGDLNRYLNISLGSLYEVLASVDTLQKNKMVTNEDFDKVLNLCEKISNKLGGFKNKLKCGKY